MPTYDYRCGSCAHEFEKFQRMSEEPGAECPQCGERAERRLSAGAGLLFKGSGFYITDYRSESYKKAASSESGSSNQAGGEDKGGAARKATGTDGGGGGSAPAPKASGSKDD